MIALACAFFSGLLAQFLKPIFHLIIYRKLDLSLFIDSGNFPSSHSAAVTGLILSLGLTTGFTSNEFAIALVFGSIVMYDAANVRYYAGKNIELTKKLIHDIEDLFKHKFSDDVYSDRIKTVLGHKHVEIFGGIATGIICTLIIHLNFIDYILNLIQ